MKNIMNRIKGRPSPVILAGILASVPWPAAALTIVPECARNPSATAIPQISCAMEMMGNVAQIILGATGSFALLMFVYGGFVMVISAGDSSKVSEGKKILMNAVFGIVVILTAGIVLRYALGILVQNNNFKLIGQPCTAAYNGVYVQQPDGAIVCQSPAETE